MATKPESSLPQSLRDQLATAIDANNIPAVETLLTEEPQLANADLRADEDRNQFTGGYPLVLACAKNFPEIAKMLLEHGAMPDAAGSDPNDQPELGLPLHYAVQHRNYRLAHLLLDHGASPNSYPNCDKATIELMFYQAREAGMSESLIRRAYARYLPDQAELETQSASEAAGVQAADATKLFARMVDLAAQPPFAAIVREGFHDLVIEIVEHSQNEDGTPHDHPLSKVRDSVAGAARWYGYPDLVRRLMDHPSYQYSYESAISTIAVAIGSHNRDGGYPEYRQIIVGQLEALQTNGDLVRAQQDPNFVPLHLIATDFTWHANYGYRAEIAAPECYVDLAELFVSWGFGDIDYRDPKSGHSALSAAVNRGHHPGIGTYIQWLLDQGADLRESDSDDVNPIAIAHKKGLEDILHILKPDTD